MSSDTLSRREFIKDAAIGAAAVAGAGVLGVSPAQAQTTAPGVPAKWDYEVDVIVVGYGGAGAVTAITATDLGAKVLILEKAPKGREGGNTRASANLWFNPTSVQDGVTYLKALSGAYTVPDEMVQLWAERMSDNDNWVKKMGGAVNVLDSSPEFPEFPGAKAFPGYHFTGTSFGMQQLWLLMSSNVAKRNIEVWYSSPATQLVQNLLTKEILGVVANKGGVSTTIKAKKAVVMTCGGFANNPEMVRDYLHLPTGYTKGTPYNTGDGHKMALQVGADFWHMGNAAGPDFNLKVPDYESAFSYTFSAATGHTILVGADATRYVDESYARRHGKIAFHGIFIPDFMPLPIHAIFDETTRKAGPVYALQQFGWNFMVEGYKWSKDNSAEVARGWIIKADTIRELATKIKKNPDTLEKTVARYNGYCATGVDPEFGRPAEALLPLSTSPYYAVELVPSFTNTQGGPRRNKDCQVLNTEGKPIARLYSGGEFGSIYSHCYQGGGNVGECIAFGRIAGEKVVALKPWDTQT